jgi:hypothetical protein
MTKAERAKLHSSINALTREEVADILKREHPRATGKRLNELAKAAIAEAHRIVSPRQQAR